MNETNPINDETNVAVLSLGICIAMMKPEISNKPREIVNITA